MTEAPAPPNTDFAILIPAYNEAAAIRAVVQGALGHCSHVIVIDDGSTDDTRGAVTDLPVRLIRHGANVGKGASLTEGIALAVSAGARWVLSMDADGQHVAEDIPAFFAAAQANPTTICP